jgi:hypothetical protein
MINIFNNECKGYKYTPIKLPSIKRIIAIGDIHGDYDLAIRLLNLGKVIEVTVDKTIFAEAGSIYMPTNVKSIKWIGGKTHVVQTGDQLDSCRPINGDPCYKKSNDGKGDKDRSDIHVFNLFTDLDKQALKHKGRVISLLGNHEINNVIGVMNSVNQDDVEYFVDQKETTKTKSGMDIRKEQFQPGEKFGKELGCSRLLFVIIGSNFFCHGGLIKPYVDKIKKPHETPIEALGRVNDMFRSWLITNKTDDKNLMKLTSGIPDNNTYGSADISILWDRILAKINPGMNETQGNCKNEFVPIMEMLNLRNMIVGHTPQVFMDTDSINGTCSNRLWRIDNALSNAFDSLIKKMEKNENRKYQVLEIIDDKIFNILSTNKR